MRFTSIKFVVPFLLICSLPVVACAGTVSPEALKTRVLATCQGLLCDLTPNSMDRPISAAEADQLMEARIKLRLQSVLRAKPHFWRRITVARRPAPRRQPAFVHVVVGKDITSLSQLSGRPVSFGPNGDPAQVVARQAFEKLGIPVQRTPLDLANALDGIATGDVAAAVLAKDDDLKTVQDLAAPDLRVLLLPKAPDPSLKTPTAIQSRLASFSN